MACVYSLNCFFSLFYGFLFFLSFEKPAFFFGAGCGGMGWQEDRILQLTSQKSCRWLLKDQEMSESSSILPGLSLCLGLRDWLRKNVL